MIALLQRELASYFKGMLGWLFSAFLLIFAGIYTMAYNLSGYYANFEYVLDSISFIYLIAVPVLTMRSIAEERRAHTDQLLYALPIRLSDVVLGKYLAMLTVLALPTAAMALYPLILRQFGAVRLGPAYGTLIAFYLLGACLLSIGLFISSNCESQVASAVITLAVLLVLYFIGALADFVSASAGASLAALLILAALFAAALWRLTRSALASALALAICAGGLFAWYAADSSAFSGLFPDIMAKLGLFDRFYAFVGGVFDLTAVIYYLSIIAVFLFLTVQSLEKRRWSE